MNKFATPDIVVIGSGPAGVSAAWPLVRRGLKVLMLEGGEPYSHARETRPSLFDLRSGHPQGARFLLGQDLRALQSLSDASPKMRTAAPLNFGNGYLEKNRLCVDRFNLIGAMASGGLSKVWGCVSFPFEQEDFANWPISLSDLKPYYKSVIERIGISGPMSDDLITLDQDHGHLDPALELSPQAARLLETYNNSKKSISFKLGQSRNAVISRDRGGRQACDRNGGCMWGCKNLAAYSSEFELIELGKFDNFSIRFETTVQSIEKTETGYRLQLVTGAEEKSESLDVKRVCVGAGCLASTRLVLAAQGCVGVVRPLQSNPAFVFALLQPKFIGSQLPRQFYGMSQLAFKSEIGNPVFGLLYEAAGLSYRELIARMPFSLKGGMVLNKYLTPALMLGLGYYPGHFSDNKIVLSADGTLKITGTMPDEAAMQVAEVKSGLQNAFRNIGSIMLPGSFSLLAPGSEVHYGATLPMGDSVTTDGEVCGLPGLYVVDGSVFPSLPAKNLTLTIMANAERIGQRIADQLRGF